MLFCKRQELKPIIIEVTKYVYFISSLFIKINFLWRIYNL